MVSSSGSSSLDGSGSNTRGKKRRKKVLVTKSEMDSEGEKLERNVTDNAESSSASFSSGSDIDSDSDSESTISLPPPLDGGWGWVVVTGSFFAHFLCDGLSYNAGVIYEHLHETFGTGAEETAWVSSVLLAVPYLLGPVSGAITDRFGCRKATIAGAIIGLAGCLLGCMVNTLPMLCLTFGLIFGLGQALVLFASSVIVPYYFRERRSLAYGIAVSGSGIGAAVLAPTLNLLFDKYGWRGMMLILGGLSLNLAVCGAVYRPLETREYKRQYKSKRNLEKFENLSLGSSESDSAATAIDQRENQDGYFYEANSPAAFTRSCYVVGSEDVSFLYPVAAEALPPITEVSEVRRKHAKRQPKNPREVTLVPVARRQQHTIAPLSRVDIFYRGSVLNNQAPLAKSHAIPNYQKDEKRATSCPHLPAHEPEKNGWTDNFVEFVEEMGMSLRRMSSISILRRPVFIWFWLSNFIFYMWFEIPLNYLPEYASKLTGSEHSYILVIIIGLITTIGQIVFGYLCDKPWVSASLLYGVGVAISGISTIFVPFITSFGGLAGYTAIVTFGSCGNTALDTIILTQLLGIRRLTNSYGLLMVGQGISSLIGAPIAGKVIDEYNQTDLTGYWICFYCAGAFLLFSGVMLIVIAPCIRRMRHWTLCVEEDDEGDEEEESDLKNSLQAKSIDYRLEEGYKMHVPSTSLTTDNRKALSFEHISVTDQNSLPLSLRSTGDSKMCHNSISLRENGPVNCAGNHASATLPQESVEANESDISPLLSDEKNQRQHLSTSDLNSLCAKSGAERPTYAETAVGYAENSDTLYKDRCLSVI